MPDANVNPAIPEEPEEPKELGPAKPPDWVATGSETIKSREPGNFNKVAQDNRRDDER